MDVKIIQACRKKQREGQRLLYEQMGSKLYYTCKRYLKKEEDIEEVMADAFYTIFTKI
jgi:DNA-directed RNA polymerase specialized sigma24 family protein